MKHLKHSVVAILTFVCSLHAQSKKEKDIQAIKNMCGCYEVTFDFAETFAYSNDSTYIGSPVKHDKGLEWVELVEDSPNKLVMQHLLIVGPPQRQSIVKHWRQDWLYENTELYMYDHNNKWTFTTLPEENVVGQWTQKVFQVDDSPRYEGTATWVHVDGKSYWENTTDAPLPRRERTKRSDYNVTVRTNRHEITDKGWIHDQDNLKVVRENGQSDFVLAKEKGLNTYTKVDDSRCKTAHNWWKENKDTWATVRAKWDTIFNKKQDLVLQKSVNGKPLFGYLLAEDFEKTDKTINEIIDAFVDGK
ncbi:hypothetical protein DFQ05_0149 [Winogradskyella wandonensis]|uniref:Uncharacterized protein n=1 Tax=Winogradskyella wandonensis TaxID=1442586 RepID=A0A4V2PU04_9FLAO|nr:DUF6607 family protein [Winogradskyella wandonensis]TCK68641.1 hypothetical protein DFQ05_0149 [Winogradskyella wandonensis]